MTSVQHPVVEGEPGIFPAPVADFLRRITRLFDRRKQPPPPASPPEDDEPVDGDKPQPEEQRPDRRPDI